MVIVEKSESEFFKGEFANIRGITEFIFITEPAENEKEYDGKKSYKIEGQIEFEGQTKNDPHTMTLNDTSRNTLIEILGKDTKKWMGIPIPINSSIGGNKKWQILVDGPRLKKWIEKNPQTEQTQI